MLEQGIYFWDHWGWEDALLSKISPCFASQEDSQRLAAKLLLNAPLGYRELNPNVVAWSQGDFSELSNGTSMVFCGGVDITSVLSSSGLDEGETTLAQTATMRLG